MADDRQYQNWTRRFVDLLLTCSRYTEQLSKRALRHRPVDGQVFLVACRFVELVTYSRKRVNHIKPQNRNCGMLSERT